MVDSDGRPHERSCPSETPDRAAAAVVGKGPAGVRTCGPGGSVIVLATSVHAEPGQHGHNGVVAGLPAFVPADIRRREESDILRGCEPDVAEPHRVRPVVEEDISSSPRTRFAEPAERVLL